MTNNNGSVDDEGYYCINVPNIHGGDGYTVLRAVTHSQRECEFKLWDYMVNAVRKGDIEEVKDVIKGSIEFIEREPVVLGHKMLQNHLNNALYEALSLNNVDMVEFLLDEGGLMYQYYDLFSYAQEEGFQEIIDLLTKRGYKREDYEMYCKRQSQSIVELPNGGVIFTKD